MNKKFFLFFVFALTSAGFAQKSEPANALEANLRKHVEYLSSDQLEGRKTGEIGATTAAGYVVNQFSLFKLKPGFKISANAKASFLQPFPYVAGVSVGENNVFRIVPNNAKHEVKYQAGVNYQLLANSANGDFPSSQLVFAGYGIATPEKKYDDFVGVELAGKIALVFDGAPDTNNPHSVFGGFNLYAKANLAKERGARALVVIARSDDFKTDPLSRLNYEPTTGETVIPVVVISRESAVKLFDVGSVSDVNEIEKWFAMKTSAPPSIQIKLAKPLEATVQLKIDLQKKTVEAYNVIGIVEGHDPILKNEAIVIGAHYDHLGRGGRSSLAANSTEIHHGADDNASGTAAIIQLASQFAKDKKNKRTIIFMAFGGEEEGLLGSKYYVNNPSWPLDKTVAMINLDMVGRLNENKLTVGGIGTAEGWRIVVEGRNAAMGESTESPVIISAPVASGNSVAPPGIPRVANARTTLFNLQLNEDGFGPSDHSSFYGKQIPVLFFFTGTHLDYHKPSDTFDKINYAGLTKITNYVSAIVNSIDRNATRPTYKVAQSAGNMATRTTFNISLGTIPSYADGNDGLTLDGVRDGSPAAKAGLKAGDMITKLAGKDVRNIQDYMFAMSTMKAGDEYEIVVKRSTETLTMKIVPVQAARR